MSSGVIETIKVPEHTDIRIALRKRLEESADKIAIKNGSTIKENPHAYYVQAGKVAGLLEAANIVDEFFKQGSK